MSRSETWVNALGIGLGALATIWTVVAYIPLWFPIWGSSAAILLGLAGSALCAISLRRSGRSLAAGIGLALGLAPLVVTAVGIAFGFGFI